MQKISEEMWDIWESGQFVGDNVPVGRAVIGKWALKQSLSSNIVAGEEGDFDKDPASWENTMRYLLHSQDGPLYEIPQIQSINIDRRIGSDAATMTMMFHNSVPPSVNDNLDETHGAEQIYTNYPPTKRELGDLGTPGAYTFRRGLVLDEGGDTNPWGHVEDPTWVDMFIPNRVIFTFQGYGTDGAGRPWDDEKLAPTGVWLIDSVDYNWNGITTIQCRDNGKLLIEQRLYPPIIPNVHYPLRFCIDHTEIDLEKYFETTTTEEVIGGDIAKHMSSSESFKGWDSSAAAWYGYNANVYGHRASHAFDGDESTYWISMRNSGPRKVYSYEWIDADTNGEYVNRIRFRPWKGGYKCWVGVVEDGKWQGSNTVPYGYTSEPAKPNDSNRPYIMELNIPQSENWVEIDLPRVYKADKVRLTFFNLQNFGKIAGGDYRAGVYEFEVNGYTAPTSTTVEKEKEVDVFIPGNIDDYTDIVKVLAGWAGFWWPYGTPNDPVLEEFGGYGGRIWGDFFDSGASPVEPPCIDPSFWDNKSVMDGINQIREILGFVFYIDSGGAIVWRPPNIWKNGNFVTGEGYVGEDSVRLVSEEKVLMDYGVNINDKALRSEIVVVSADDSSVYGAYEPGFAVGETAASATDTSDLALLGGQQRVMVVPNYPFGTADSPNALAEVEKFAYLTSLWIHWSYRTSRFKIPGNPAFEPDDQIRIFERTTSEAYSHYILGTRSSMDIAGGTWTMDVDTHWLGNGPSDQWVVNYKGMTPALYAYLKAIGQIPDDELGPERDADWATPPDIELEDPITRENWRARFPDLVIPVIAPPDIDFETGDLDPYVEYPLGGGSGGGTAYACGNTMMFQNWGIPDGRNRRRIKFMSKWPSSDYFTHVNQSIDQYVEIRSDILLAVRLLQEICKEEEWDIKYCSGYVVRRVRDGVTWSNHAWGVALDLNSDVLPYRSPAPQGHAVYRIAQKALRCRTGAGTPVFSWGGYFKTHDPMHFQVCASPEALATGVARSAAGPFGPF